MKFNFLINSTTKFIDELTLSWLTAGANKTIVQVETFSEASLSQTLLARRPWNDRQFDFFEDDLVFAFLAENVFSPTRREAAAVIEDGILRWQANGADVLLELHWMCQEQQSDVVEQTALVEVFVDDQIGDVVIGVREQLVLSLRVPFSGSHLQSRWAFALDAMSG